MSYSVLVIPEDPTLNGYILRPLVERIFEEQGKPNASIKVATQPRAQGYDQAKKLIEGEFVDRYRHYKLWLFFPDADRAAGLLELEVRMKDRGVHLICCAPQPELEAWLLAGHLDKLPARWPDVRNSKRLKEDFFSRFMAEHGNPDQPGGGRERLMRAALANFEGLKNRCEEIQNLQKRIAEALAR